jgi:ribosomal protein L21E
MGKGKQPKQKGKIRLSDYFKIFKEGDKVAIVKEQSVVSAYPARVIGKTGKVIATRGRYKVVELNDGNKVKQFIIHPIHLKKLK